MCSIQGKGFKVPAVGQVCGLNRQALAVMCYNKRVSNKAKMLYLITDGEYYKLGYSVDPNKRLKALQTAHPKPLRLLAVSEGGYADEAYYHSQLEATKQNGEWFSLSHDLLKLVSSWALPMPERARNCVSLSQIRIHTTALGRQWFNLTDIAGILNVRASNLKSRKAIHSKLFKINGELKSLYVNEASFRILFQTYSSIIEELDAKRN